MGFIIWLTNIVNPFKSSVYMASVFDCPLTQFYVKTNTRIEEQNIKNYSDFVVLSLQSWNFQGNPKYKIDST